MNIGTKSILFGAHQFFIHPWFVAWAWWQLYGIPADFRLWIAFFVHDLGYWGKPNMDGPEGETHVEWAADLMGKLFGHKWRDFCLYHSRFYAKRDGKHFSRLCVADKYSFVLTPKWLYLPLVKATREIHEYMDLAKVRTELGEPKYASMNISTDTYERWYYDVKEYLRRWALEHKDGRKDTWTPSLKIWCKCKTPKLSGETGEITCLECDKAIKCIFCKENPKQAIEFHIYYLVCEDHLNEAADIVYNMAR